MADDNKTADPVTDNLVVPEWVPEKFRSNPEKFAESYTELERRLTEESQHRSALEQNFGELSSQFEQLQTERQNQTQQAPGAADPFIAAYGAAIEQGDYRSALEIQAQLSQLAAAAEVQKALPSVTQQMQQLGASQEQEIAAMARNSLVAQYGEAFSPEVEAAMHDLLSKNPNYYPEQARYDVNAARAAFDNVYKIATYGSQSAANALNTTQMKEQAQTAQGAGGRALTPDQEKEEWDAIRSAKPKEYWQ